MKRIIFMLLPLLVLMLAFRPVQSRVITGVVTDDKGMALSGVTVQEKGTTHMVVSGSDGHFSITVTSRKPVLVFSYVGYVMQQVSVDDKTSMAIALKQSVARLEEVVVVGYGVSRKMSVTGSVSSIAGRTVGVYIQGSPMGYPYDDGKNTEDYDGINENRFHTTSSAPVSTFSIDVDAASYSNVRRFINQGQLPPAGAVRIEEMINYFHYDYPQPVNGDPFSIQTEIADAPWNPGHKLVLIGLQGKKIPMEHLPASNLVFLIDVSGSMGSPNKLPLVKASLKMLVDQLRQDDHVALVVYAGAAGLVLPPANGTEKTKIKDAIDQLESGGSTAGGAGLRLAYKTAREHFIAKGNNRVILCTDGDFNVGESSDDAMERLVEEERKSGVFLTVLGYGMGNYKDNKMQKLADKGNGNHAYIDGLAEAKKVLVNEFGGTLFAIAKDVKLQVEFNPAKVAGYRLIGYENRMLAREDFNNDKKDAGELGSGHTVTALYEVIPAGVESEFLEQVDDLKYQQKVTPISKTSFNKEIMTVKFRYKAPDGEVSKLIEHPVTDTRLSLAAASDNFRFAAAVAQFGMLLRNSEFKSGSSWESTIALAQKAKGKDEEGYRAEFIALVTSCKALAKAVKKEPLGEEVVGLPSTR